MDWEFVAPMVVSLALILTCGGVLLLRPVARRFGDLLELMADERRSGASPRELEQIRSALESLDSRLETLDARVALVEERQDFAEALLGKEAAHDRIAGAPESDRPS